MEDRKGWLVLSREPGEEILIGDDIRIIVASIPKPGNKVKIGIKAPRGVPVDRKEVRDSKDANSR